MLTGGRKRKKQNQERSTRDKMPCDHSRSRQRIVNEHSEDDQFGLFHVLADSIFRPSTKEESKFLLVPTGQYTWKIGDFELPPKPSRKLDQSLKDNKDNKEVDLTVNGLPLRVNVLTRSVEVTCASIDRKQVFRKVRQSRVCFLCDRALAGFQPSLQ